MTKGASVGFAVGNAVGSIVCAGDGVAELGASVGLGAPTDGVGLGDAVGTAPALAVADAPGEAVGAAACWHPNKRPAARTTATDRVVMRLPLWRFSLPIDGRLPAILQKG
jgi:hypothetical protein